MTDEELLDLATECEWEGPTDAITGGWKYCPVCMAQSRFDGHAPSCPMGQLVAALRERVA